MNYEKNKIIQEMFEDDGIKAKDLGDGIYSLNFISRVFKKKAWSTRRCRARGFFYDIYSNKIIARSFDKFFEERDKNGKSVSEFQYPVTLYRKENGFLGITSGGKDGRELFIASKSTNKGEFRDMFAELLKRYVGESMMSAMANYLYRNNLSAIFEVIDPVRDPHIVEYDKSCLVLLALVENEIEFKQRPYAEVKWFADLIRVEPKQKAYTAANESALRSFFAASSVEEGFEGFVIEDASGYMAKWKSHWYKYWKRYRSVINSSKPVEHWTNQGLERDIVELIYSWRKENPNKNIIDFRNWYEHRLDK